MRLRSYTVAILMAVASSLILAGKADARDYYVSPHGSDADPGTKEEPFATLAKASSVLSPGDTCYLREGMYQAVLRPERSGEPGRPITITNYRDERVIISGADQVRDFEPRGEGVYAAPMPWSMPLGNQVFVDGQMLSEACWPNAGPKHLYEPKRAVVDEGSAYRIMDKEIPGPQDAWKGAEIWCAGGSAWFCWTADIIGYDAKSHTLKLGEHSRTSKSYAPRKGSLYVLRGVRRALDAPGEWFYDHDQKELLLIPPKGANMEMVTITAKRRDIAIDLSGRSYIHINGIEIIGAGLLTDKNSSHIALKNMTGSYVAHSYREGVSGKGVSIAGENHLVQNCDFGFSSGSVLSTSGNDHRIINNYIHHGGYRGYAATVGLRGRRILFSHNTVRHSGRDLVGTHQLMESLVQYNDVSEAGWLTKDLGMFYGHSTDFANTVFRYNFVHTNHAKKFSIGIYFDHVSHNAIVHHNAIWNVGSSPIVINNPSYNGLVFNNTCWRSEEVFTWDHRKRNDLFGMRLVNNIFSKPPKKLPKNVVQENNLVMESPPFRDAEKRDFRLKGGVGKGVGAFEPNKKPWHAGCDLKNPPNPLPVYEAPRIPWMNMIKNSCFEFGTLEGWRKTDAGKAEVVKGNGWGFAWGNEKKTHATGTAKKELKLGPGRVGIEQMITELDPNTEYKFTAWLRVSSREEKVVMGVKDFGAEELTVSSSDEEWVRKSVDFKTGPKSTTATIYILKSSQGKGLAWCDNMTLPLTAKK